MSDNIKETLINWIFTAENEGETKRLPGLMTELSFCRHIFRTRQNQFKLSNAAYGWFYISADAQDTARHWFKVHSGEPVFNITEKVFINTLSPLGHRFFILRSNLSASIRTGRLISPAVCINAFELKWHEENGPFCENTSVALDYAESINERLGEKLNEKFRKDSDAGSSALKSHFAALGETALEELFATRCIMNFGFEAPRDLDAVALDRDNKPVVIEFKRKYQAKGRAILKNQKNNTPEQLIENAFQIEEWPFPEDESDLETFKKYCAELDMEYKGVPCFGLDLSHFNTVKMCDAAGIKYLYLIWDSYNESRFVLQDSTKKSGKPKRLNVHEVLLDHDFFPRENPSLLYRYIDPSQVSGVTFTSGDDSGAYTDKVRIQVTFDKLGFEPKQAPI